jgi:Phage integrase family
VRVVEVSPDLAEVVSEHLAELQRRGASTTPNDYLIQNSRGGRVSRQRVAQIVGEAAAQASLEIAEKGLPPLPQVTPHTLRRTIALLANDFDVKWVMDQVGHADSTMTMDVYAQLQQRAKRSHGARFDRLLRDARRQLVSLPTAHGPGNGTRGREALQAGDEATAPRSLETGAVAAQACNGETRIRTGDTTIFSRVLYQLSYLAADRSPARLARRPIVRSSILPARRSRPWALRSHVPKLRGTATGRSSGWRSIRASRRPTSRSAGAAS